MKVLTKQEVLRRIEEVCKPYVTYQAAADAIGCSAAQLSDARQDRCPPCPAILKKIGVQRERLYVVEMEGKYRDGAMKM